MQKNQLEEEVTWEEVKTFCMEIGTEDVISADCKGLPACWADEAEEATAGSAKGMLGMWGAPWGTPCAPLPPPGMCSLSDAGSNCQLPLYKVGSVAKVGSAIRTIVGNAPQPTYCCNMPTYGEYKVLVSQASAVHSNLHVHVHSRVSYVQKERQREDKLLTRHKVL